MFEFAADEWLVSVVEPEEVGPEEVPPQFGELAEGLRYRIGMTVEGGPGQDGWTFVRQILESLGRALGGVGLDPEPGTSSPGGGRAAAFPARNQPPDPTRMTPMIAKPTPTACTTDNRSERNTTDRSATNAG